jgi:hypothetical protein
MNWYYARDGKQDGPHPDESIRELAKTGAIDPATLIWSEGMPDWQPISQAAPHLLPAAGLRLAAGSDTAQAACAECGTVLPASELISLQGEQICAQCKPARLQRMREGVVTSSRSGELARLLKVAKAQRGVNLCLLLSLVCYVLIFAGAGFTAERGAGANSAGGGAALISIAGSLGILVVAVFQVIYVYRLASSLGTGVPILWVLGILFLSCIGLILLLVLSSKATKQLRDAGFKVGLLGGNPADVERRMSGG